MPGGTCPTRRAPRRSRPGTSKRIASDTTRGRGRAQHHVGEGVPEQLGEEGQQHQPTPVGSGVAGERDARHDADNGKQHGAGAVAEQGVRAGAHGAPHLAADGDVARRSHAAEEREEVSEQGVTAPTGVQPGEQQHPTERDGDAQPRRGRDRDGLAPARSARPRPAGGTTRATEDATDVSRNDGIQVAKCAARRTPATPDSRALDGGAP